MRADVASLVLRLPHRPVRVIEPFAGGASVSIHLVKENIVSGAILNDLDPDIFNFWSTVFSSKNIALQSLISSFKADQSNLHEWLDADSLDDTSRAFQYLLKNRVSRGGVVAPGAGVLKRGENDKGVFSRWYPTTLNNRLQALYMLRHRFTVFGEDAFELLNVKLDRSFYFVDPPYSVSDQSPGARLYRASQLNHEQLINALAGLDVPWMFTQRDELEVRAQLIEKDLLFRETSLKNSHNLMRKEIVAYSRHFRLLLEPTVKVDSST